MIYEQRLIDAASLNELHAVFTDVRTAAEAGQLDAADAWELLDRLMLRVRSFFASDRLEARRNFADGYRRGRVFGLEQARELLIDAVDKIDELELTDDKRTAS
jgi:hypothetical protein